MDIEVAGILLVNLAAAVMIALILVYLIQDRRRFRVERQFRSVRGLFDEWVELAAALPGCGETAAAYQKTSNVSKKYCLIAELIRFTHGQRTARMLALEEELTPFTQIYEGLAEAYNRRLLGRFREPVMRMLGFRYFPSLRFDAEK